MLAAGDVGPYHRILLVTIANNTTATPGNGYLEALVSPKTTVYTTSPGRVTERGFIDPEGAAHEVDVSLTISRQCWTLIGTGHHLRDRLRYVL
jgi:hypothetical protein